MQNPTPKLIMNKKRIWCQRVTVISYFIASLRVFNLARLISLQDYSKTLFLVAGAQQNSRSSLLYVVTLETPPRLVCFISFFFKSYHNSPASSGRINRKVPTPGVCCEHKTLDLVEIRLGLSNSVANQFTAQFAA